MDRMGKGWINGETLTSNTENFSAVNNYGQIVFDNNSTKNCIQLLLKSSLRWKQSGRINEY